MQLGLELTLQVFLIFAIKGMMLFGPRAQLSPTTAAPASSSWRQASSNGIPSIVESLPQAARVITAGAPGIGRGLSQMFL